MSKKVLFVKFHQGLFVPALGTLGDTLPSQSKTIQELFMTLEDNYLIIEGSSKGVKTKAVVPVSNIAVMVVEANNESQPKAVVIRPVCQAV